MNTQQKLNSREDCMALRKISILSTVLAALITVIAVNTHAQEAKWRVINDAKPKIVPDYTEYKSPFPYKPKPVAVPQRVVKKALPVEQELLRQRKIADLINNVRNLMQSPSFAKPDLSFIKTRVKGIITGESNSSVLLGNTWYKTGLTISVPRKHVAKAQRLVRELADLDKEVAEPLEIEIEDMIGTSKELSLTLVSINNNSILMETTAGEKFSLDMSSKHSN